MTDHAIEEIRQGQSQAISFATVVPAPPAEVFALLTDTARHADIDGSGTVKGARSGGTRLTAVGDTFGMQMHLGVPYPMRNTVVEFAQDRLICWRHAGRHRWRYELSEVDGGTQVVETFDWEPALAGFAYEAMGWPERHRQNIPATLRRLQAVFDA